MKVYEMGGACSRNDRGEKYAEYFSRKESE
jgi:hypothetical protein